MQGYIISECKEFNTASKMLQKYTFGLLFMALTSTASATESCDVMAAVKCFSAMPSVIDVEAIADDPHKEMVGPCTENLDTVQQFKDCINAPISGCPTIAQDIEISATESTRFCNSVTTDCRDAGGFHMKYQELLKCHGAMYYDLINNTMTREDRCLKLENCLIKSKESCAALEHHVKEAWQNGMFKDYCETANATFVLNDPNAFTDTSLDDMKCKKLDKVAMDIANCYTISSGNLKASDQSVSSYCSIVSEFHGCSSNVLKDNECAEFQSIFNASMEDYKKAISVFCGTSNPEEVNDVCDISAVKSCFSKMDTSVLKLEQLLMENGAYITDHLQVQDNARQITEIAKDLQSMCSSAGNTTLEVENCMDSSMSSCPGGYRDAFQLNAEFIRNLCSQINNCTTDETFNNDLAQCTTNALTQLQELGSQDVDLAAFASSFCGIFKDLLLCMRGVIQPCTGETEETEAMYHMIIEDISQFCPASSFTNFTTDTLSDDMKQFLACTDLVDKSDMIHDCSATYLKILFESTTNSSHLCQNINNWQTCIEDVISQCPVLERDMLKPVHNTREALSGMCPEPVTPPPDNAGEGENNNGDTGNNEGDDKDGEDNGGRSVMASLLLAVTLLLLQSIL